MQPNNKAEVNEQSGPLLMRTIRQVLEARRQREVSNLDLPETLGIKLTNRCNLRCEHCYQWNESGYHHDMIRAEQNLDLDVAVFERLLKETRPVKSRLYLWGGEPLFHSGIERILELLEQDPRQTTICTNAVYIGKYIEPLCRISEDLEFLIAIEGFEIEHNRLRGKGSFTAVMVQIDELLRRRVEGTFKGRISVHTVINDGMIGRLYELMEFYEAKKIDLVMLTFPWFISEQTSRDMDAFVDDVFYWLIDRGNGRHSWDAFKYHIDPEKIGLLIEDIGKINSRVWTTKIRYQPDLEFDEIEGFVRGRTMIVKCASTCRVLNTRADVTPNGAVSACKFFSEFTVGNLHDQPLAKLWRSEQYNRIRQALGKQLSPACSKCSVLYLHAHSTPLHF